MRIRTSTGTLASLALISLIALSGCGDDEAKPIGGPGATNQPVQDAAFPQEPGTAFGRWATGEMQGEGITFQYRLYVNRQNQVSMGFNCTNGNRSTTHMKTAKVTIQAEQQIMTLNEDLVLNDGNCDVTIAKTNFQYGYQNETLTLIDQTTNRQLDFTRAN
jgi:hypothetical protein